MAIEVETKDCTQLSDAELAEMADICAEGPSPLRGRAAVEAGRGVGARHPGPGGRQAQGLLLLHPRAHRRHARACSSAWRRSSAPPSATRCSGRSCTTSSAGPCWPSPTRTCSSAPASSTPAGFEAFKALDDIVPRPDHKATRRGAGLGPAPGQALRRRDRQLRRPHLRRQGRRRRSRCVLDHESLKPESHRRRGRGAVRRRRRQAGATRSSPSAGRWPRTSPSSS